MMDQRKPGEVRSRAEITADSIRHLARDKKPGDRIGSRAELLQRCGVSVGTLHEALRLLQSTGEITVRTGPQGGVFAGHPSPLGALLRLERSTNQPIESFPRAARVLAALHPLLIEDAIAAMDTRSARTLENAWEQVASAAPNGLRAVAEASLELFSVIVELSPPGLLWGVAATIIRGQIHTLRSGPPDPFIDPGAERVLIEGHVAQTRALIDAIIARDQPAALAAQHDPAFLGLFRHLYTAEPPSVP